MTIFARMLIEWKNDYISKLARYVWFTKEENTRTGK